MTCKHTETRQSGESRPFFASVARHPYTDENRAAHGNIEWTEECCQCGAERMVNENGHHTEVGPWGPSREAREQREQAEAKKKYDAIMARGIALCGEEKVRVGAPTRDGNVRISRGGDTQWCRWYDIQIAAKQYDGYLAAVYTAMVEAIRRHPDRHHDVHRHGLMSVRRLLSSDTIQWMP